MVKAGKQGSVFHLVSLCELADCGEALPVDCNLWRPGWTKVCRRAWAAEAIATTNCSTLVFVVVTCIVLAGKSFCPRYSFGSCGLVARSAVSRFIGAARGASCHPLLGFDSSFHQRYQNLSAGTPPSCTVAQGLVLQSFFPAT